LQNVKAKDDEEELPDSSTAAAALAPESNVEHIKQVQEKMDTGVLDGAADESDRILGKKKGKKKMFKKNGNGKGAIVNPWVNSSGSGSGSSSDTAMDLADAQAIVAAQAEYDELQEERITLLKIALDECKGDLSALNDPDGNEVLNAVGQCNPGGIVGAFNRDICRGYTCSPGPEGYKTNRDCFNSEYAICVIL